MNTAVAPPPGGFQRWLPTIWTLLRPLCTSKHADRLELQIASPLGKVLPLYFGNISCFVLGTKSILHSLHRQGAKAAAANAVKGCGAGQGYGACRRNRGHGSSDAEGNDRVVAWRRLTLFFTFLCLFWRCWVGSIYVSDVFVKGRF